MSTDGWSRRASGCIDRCSIHTHQRPELLVGDEAGEAFVLLDPFRPDHIGVFRIPAECSMQEVQRTIMVLLRRSQIRNAFAERLCVGAGQVEESVSVFSGKVTVLLRVPNCIGSRPDMLS